MSGFQTSAQADAFAIRRKNRDFTECDVEAVWSQAHRELRREGVIRASHEKITDRCLRILERAA